MCAISYLDTYSEEYYNDIFTKTFLQYSNVDIDCKEYVNLFINTFPIEMICDRPQDNFNIIHDKILEFSENKFVLRFYEKEVSYRKKVIPKNSICFAIKKNVDRYTFQQLMEESIRQSVIPRLRYNVLSFNLGEVSDINLGKLCTYNTYIISKDNKESIIAWGCLIPNAVFDLDFSSKPYVGYTQYIDSDKENSFNKIKLSLENTLNLRVN